eukprot:g7635.t1
MPKTFTLKQLEVYKGEDDAERHEGKVVFAVRDAKSAANATKYNVYDVTKYLEDHPGGDDIMKENSGMDASDEFWDIGHSEQAMDDMKQYIIGQLSDEDCAALKEKASSGGAGGSGSMLPILVLVLLVAACGAAFVYT